MALKLKIDKATYDALQADVQAEYNLVGKDYVLDVEGIDTKASEKFDKERDRRRAAEKRAADAEKAMADLQDAGSVEEVKAAADAKYAKLEKKYNDEAAARKKETADSMKNSKVTELANNLSKTSAKLLIPHVAARLDVTWDNDGKPSLVVLDAEGKPSQLTTDQLAKEFRDNKEFAGIVTASLASGGGASKQAGGTGGGGIPAPMGTGQQQSQQPVSLGAMSSKDLVAHLSAVRASQGKETV